MQPNDVCPSGVQPDERKCGIGRGADCCIYLMVQPEAGLTGFVCGRGGVLAATVEARAAAGEMKSHRRPIRPYPECQDEGWSN